MLTPCEFLKVPQGLFSNYCWKCLPQTKAFVLVQEKSGFISQHGHLLYLTSVQKASSLKGLAVGVNHPGIAYFISSSFQKCKAISAFSARQILGNLNFRE